MKKTSFFQSGWCICIVASLFFFFQFMLFNLLSPLDGYFSNLFSLTPVQFGWFSSLYGFALTAFFMPAGMLLDRYPIKPVLLIAISLSVLSLLGLAQSHFLILAAVARVIEGMAHAIAFLGAMRLIYQWLMPESAFAVGVMVTIGLLGGVAAQAPFHYFSQITGTVFAIYGVMLIGAGIALLLFLFVQENTQRPIKKQTVQVSMSATLRYFLSRPLFVMGALYISLMDTPTMVLGAVWGNRYLAAVTHLSLEHTSIILCAIFLGTVIGSLCWGKLADRTGYYRFTMVASALLALGCASIVNSATHLHLTEAMALIFLLGFFTAAQSLGYPIIMRASPSYATSQIMSITSIIVMGVGTCFQPIFGWVIEHPFLMTNSYQQAFAIIQLLLFISAIVGWIMFQLPAPKQSFN